jgi:hypothetical protein
MPPSTQLPAPSLVSHQTDTGHTLEQHLLRTRQRHKDVAQWLKHRVRAGLELLDEVVLIVNARMPGLQGFGAALRHHVLDPAAPLVAVAAVGVKQVSANCCGSDGSLWR